VNLLRGNQVFSPLRYVEFSPQREFRRRLHDGVESRTHCAGDAMYGKKLVGVPCFLLQQGELDFSPAEKRPS
jgi:hypothetical protein